MSTDPPLPRLQAAPCLPRCCPKLLNSVTSTICRAAPEAPLAVRDAMHAAACHRRQPGHRWVAAIMAAMPQCHRQDFPSSKTLDTYHQPKLCSAVAHHSSQVEQSALLCRPPPGSATSPRRLFSARSLAGSSSRQIPPNIPQFRQFDKHLQTGEILDTVSCLCLGWCHWPMLRSGMPPQLRSCDAS